ncbi:caprin-2-like [Mya arenaria]|uniref:caprin-2-like n=1 Tax=Mya arenaria TaxID=6604 RepID=UPI0022E757D0|nr:caprin-2-like [Mya arenaria]
MLKLVCLIVLCSATSTRAEPECSRFHYEEKTLEKMVRLEFLVEQFKVEMDNFRIEKKVILNEIRKDVSNEIAKLRQSVEVDKATHADALSEMEKVYTNLTEVHRALQQLQATQKMVAFSAKKIQNQSPSSGDVLIFFETVQDTDGTYNNRTGRFVAPVSGTYVLTAHLCSASGNTIKFALRNNGVVVARSSVYNEHNCNSLEAFVKVDTGHEMYVTVSNSGVNIYQDDTTRWNTFSARLFHGML